MATAAHETDQTMQPIAEYGKGKGKPYGKPGRYGQAQYGRGYVQLTWDDNYERTDEALGLNGALLKDSTFAMQPDIAAQILRGCVEGWFTGKRLGDYLPGDYRRRAACCERHGQGRSDRRLCPRVRGGAAAVAGCPDNTKTRC